MKVMVSLLLSKFFCQRVLVIFSNFYYVWVNSSSSFDRQQKIIKNSTKRVSRWGKGGREIQPKVGRKKRLSSKHLNGATPAKTELTKKHQNRGAYPQNSHNNPSKPRRLHQKTAHQNHPNKTNTHTRMFGYTLHIILLNSTREIGKL